MWNRELDFSFFPARMATLSLGVLGMMGAILSITGIFGMAAYSVSKRLRELGIRIALGAQRTGGSEGCARTGLPAARAGLRGGVGAGTAGDAECWPSSCIRQRRAIRWCWRGAVLAMLLARACRRMDSGAAGFSGRSSGPAAGRVNRTICAERATPAYTTAESPVDRACSCA